MVRAVLAAEDRDFFEHGGVDASAILRAAWADVRGRRLQGGSTITQQYVKLAYVGTERTLVRKLKEATLAVKLERKLDKEEILERYLNLIYFGRGAHGIEAAAFAYFGKTAAELDVAEASYLAGLIRAPEAADATNDPEEADRRRNSVLRALAEEGYITAADRDAIAAVPVRDYVRPRTEVVQDKVVAGDVGTQYFVEHVRRQLADRFGDARVNGGGLRVHTSLDLDLQRAAHDAVYREVLHQPGDPAGALVAIDTDGYVRAMVGGRDWNDEADPYARVNFATGVDGGGTGRQAGSSFKPFVLATAVADGYTVESAFDSPSKIVFEGANNGRDYTVNNYGGSAHGRIDLVDATRQSSNTVYAQLLDAIGPERVVSVTERLGIDSELSPVLSLTLGTSSVSVQEMAEAYLTFATHGVHVEPITITKVTDSSGEVLWEAPVQRTPVMEERDADVVTHVLQQVVLGGTGTRARLSRSDAAGKTGTTQHNGDAWFVGYTPGLSTAVWMGYPEGQDREMDDVHGIAVTGGTLPAQIWHAFMEVATQDDRFAGRFGDPPDLSEGRLVPESGRVAPAPTTSTTDTTVGDGSTTTTVEGEGEDEDGPTTTTSTPEDDTGETTTTSTTAVEVTTTTTSTVP
ncbi:MAG TPA: PBP1A family penicillin-binding protein, partial [Acidimicrobiales bacterium]|nr:PBP1A family penicillin-binding protein [Acidimicrobiales bacterium]